MAIKTQVRLAQITGSLPTFKPGSFAAGGLAANPLVGPLVGEQNMDGVLKYFAQALSNMHGDLEFGDNTPGYFQAKDGSNYDLALHQQDAGQAISFSSVGQLKQTAQKDIQISSSLAQENAIQIATSAGGLKMHGTSNIDMVSGGQFLMTGSNVIVAAGSVDSLDLDGGANLRIGFNKSAATDFNATTFDLDASGALAIDSATSISIGATADVPFIMQSTTMQIDSAGDSHWLTSDTKDIVLGEGVNDAAHTMLRIIHDSGVAANEKILIQNFAGTTGDAIKLYGKAGGIWLDSDSANADAINIDSGGGILLDAAAAVSIDAATNSNVTVTGANQNLDLAVAGGGTNQLLLNSAGTGTNAIDINATAGGMDVDISAALSILAGDDSDITVSGAAKDLALGVSGGGAQVLQLNSAGTGTDAIDINATAGGLDVDIAGGIAILGGLGATILTADDMSLTLGKGINATDTRFVLTHDAGTAANEKILIHNEIGSAVDSIKLNSDAGGIEINVPDGQTVALGKAGGVEVMIQPHGTAGAEKYSVLNSGGTDVKAVLLAAVAGGLCLSGSTSLSLSGSGLGVKFSADYDTNLLNSGMDPALAGDMAFAKFSEFATFRGKSMFSNTTTVIGALNALATAQGDTEPTLFSLILNANIDANADVTVVKTAGETASLVKTVGEQNARVYVNGQLMKSSSGGVTNDYVIQDTNDLRFQFDLKIDDVVQVMDYSS